MKHLIAIASIVLILTGISARCSIADSLKIAHVFQDGMVLQSGKTVPVWGWAQPGNQVTVKFAEQNKTGVVDADGYWQVELDPLEVATDGRHLTVSDGENTIELQDILVGEVWVCAGQSNMAWALDKTMHHYPALRQRLGATDFPLIRFIVYPPHSSPEPLHDMHPHVSAQWKSADASTVQSSMAMPFFFARELQRELNIPVGLIQVAVGATSQTAWSPKEVIDHVAEETGSRLTYEFLYKQAEERGRERLYPGVLFNSQIHPLIPFAFRGMIWHQGEGGPHHEHAERMVALVNHWRKIFKHDFYFLWGALSRQADTPPPLAPMAIIGYRASRNLQFLQAQKLFGYDGKSIFCDFYDLGNFQTHFGEKDRAGKRFALAALNYAYYRPHVFTGPQLIKTEIRENEISLQFTHTGSGLVYQPSLNGISGFVLQNGTNYCWIEPTEIKHDTFVFRDGDITPESLIYYGYALNPHETLFNREGFPGSIFPAPTPAGFSNRPPLDDPVKTVEFIGPRGENVHLNFTHTRRNAYVFGLVSWQDWKTWSRNQTECRVAGAGKGSRRMQVYIPAEWEAVAARHAGKTVPLSDITIQPGGERTAEMDVEINAGPYVIYNQGKENEALAEADVSRF